MATPTPELSPRVARNRRRVIDAACLCFTSHGYAKTTVEEIALRAGVSKGLVYQHFRGKEQILEAALDHTLEAWADASHIDVEAAGGSVFGAIAEMHRSALAYARANPAMGALFQLEPLVTMSIGAEAVRKSMERFRTHLGEVIDLGIERGELRADLDPERLGDVIRLFNMAFVGALLDPEWIDASDERLIETSIEVLARGLLREAP